ncbi:hypothetical protein AC1031_014985 [Aphanomyces cochlioides]|nr:hypothetical protein AC1031_014985 [Aphanomyces cochlioides]
MSQSVAPKRQCFNEEEDVLLLRQICAELPFQAKRGKVMDAWESVATNLQELEEFKREGFSGKTAQNRFDIMIKEHRESSNKSKSASGIAEDVSERTALLDELVELLDDTKSEETPRSEKSRLDVVRNEQAGAIVRDEAIRQTKNAAI